MNILYVLLFINVLNNGKMYRLCLYTNENTGFRVFFCLTVLLNSTCTLKKTFQDTDICSVIYRVHQAGGSLEMFMTEDQKKYYKAMKRMQAKSPIKAIPRPTVSIVKPYP